MPNLNLCQKSTFLSKKYVLNIWLYMRSPKSEEMIFVIFQRFLNLGPFLGPFLGTWVKNKKKQKSCAWYISIFMHLVKKSERPYLGPQNAFSQNVHFLGPKWIIWSWAGKNFKEAKKVVRGSKEFKGGAILFPWS